MNIKVSGITSFKQLKQLEGLDIDYAAITFEKDSPDYGGDSLPAADIKKADFDLRVTGIFSNPEMIDVLDAIDDFGLDAVQLNGEESPEMCDDLGSEVEVIKAFKIDPDSGVDVDKLVEPYDGVCDFYLFEMQGADSWNYLKKFRIEKPFFLSGNFKTSDASVVRSFRHSDFFGIDLREQFDKSPGEKDMAMILAFKQALK